MLIFALARRGYGKIDDLDRLDTDRLYDLVEYEMIQQDLELWAAQSNGSG